MLKNSLQALNDIDAKPTKEVLFAGQLLSALGIEITEKKSEELRKHLQTCTYSNYQRAILFNRIAEICRDQLKQTKKAKDCLEESLNIEPEYESALFNYCRFISTSEPEKAIEKIQKILTHIPNYPDLFFMYGYCKNIINKHEEAIEQYQKATKINPNNADYWGNLGWNYYMLKDYPKSIEASRKGLEIDDKAIWIRCNLAIALLYNEHLKETKDVYQEVIQIIISGKYSDTAYKENKEQLLQDRALDDLYDARKDASGKLLDQINEIIKMLEKAKERL